MIRSIVEQTVQDLSSYTQQDRDTWKKLLSIQLANLQGIANHQFIQGLMKLEGLIQDIPDISKVSKLLYQSTQWRLLPVVGLLKSQDYFYLLADRCFPVATFIRKGDNLNYSPVPDLWHDVFGHIPLLFHPEYSDFVAYLGQIYVEYQEMRTEISNLYWYTIEAGLCYENGEHRVYGSSQLSSIEEIIYAVSDRPRVFPFELLTVMNCPVKIDELQSRIFIIPTFEDLRTIQNQLQETIEQQKAA